MVSAMLVLERHLQLRERNGQWYKNILGWAAPEKRNIDLLFYSFFDQMWKMVVNMFTDICIVHIHFFCKGKFCEGINYLVNIINKFYFSYDFLLWTKFQSCLFLHSGFFLNYFSCANQYVQIEQTVQVYKNIHFSLH